MVRPSTSRTFGARNLGIETYTETPGFDFRGVALRVFPLRANIARLQSFLDEYLNISPFAYFRPASPFILFNAINYGRMEPEATDIGWTTQDEFTFSIPLYWYRKNRNGWVFHASASVTPYLFVDDPSSVVTGREVYGWPKVLANVAHETNPWMHDPRADRRLVVLETGQFSELFADRQLKQRPLLEIVQRDAQTLLSYPPDTERLLAPALIGPPSVVRTGWALAEQLIALQRDASRRDRPDLMARFSGLMAQANPTAPTHAITLKQFRASEPGLLCYQALVDSTLRVRHFEAGGPLGDIELLRGDPSAGFSLRLREHAGFPIVDKLGLSVDRTESLGGETISTLLPFFPYWVKADLSYSFGQRIAWRTESSGWYGPDGGEPRSPKPNRPNLYNTALGAMSEPQSGPFDLTDTHLRVLPLRASAAAVRKLLGPLDDALRQVAVHPDCADEDHPMAEPFPVFTSTEEDGSESELCLVLMVVASREHVSDPSSDLGWWSDRSVSFGVVVKLADPLVADDAETSSARRFFLYWPKVYADSPMAVINGRETTGVDMTQAKIENGRDPWIDALPSEEIRRLLDVTIKDFPVLGAGAESVESRLLEILQGASGETVETSAEARPKARAKPKTQSAASAKATKQSAPEERLLEFADDLLSRQEIAAGLHLYNLALKQFPDESKPFDRSCYQAIVVYETLISRWQRPEHERSIEIERLPPGLSVRFHELGSFPLVHELGLVGKTRAEPRARSRSVTPESWAFALRVDERRLLPRDIFFRTFDGHWQDAEEQSALGPGEHHPGCSARPAALSRTTGHASSEIGDDPVGESSTGGRDVGRLPMPELAPTAEGKADTLEPARVLTLDDLFALWLKFTTRARR